MRALAKPGDDARAHFNACVGNTIDTDLLGRLEARADAVGQAGDVYDASGTGGGLGNLAPLGGLEPDVSDLRKLYVRKMLPPGGPGRPLYDRLRLSSVLCPLCGQRQADTLDHCLPKSGYPEFSILPINLVPACGACNKAKDTYVPADQRELLLHPYYDDIEGARWLVAEVTGDLGAAVVEFSIAAPEGGSPEIETRLRAHLRVLGLDRLYSVHAAEEMAGIRRLLSEIRAAAGVEGVQAHLIGVAMSQEASRRNSWKTAAYFALAASAQFCGGDLG